MDYLALLTKQTTVNGLTFRMFPYQTAKAVDEYGKLIKVHGDDIPVNMQNFIILDTGTLEITADDTADDAHKALAAFWSDRPSTFEERYNAGYCVFPTAVRDTWLAAFERLQTKPDADAPTPPDDDAPEA